MDSNNDTLPKLTDVLLAGDFIPKEQFDAFNDWLESRGEPRITSFVTREEYNRRATQPAQTQQSPYAWAEYWGELAQQKADLDARRGVSMPVSYYASTVVGALLATQPAHAPKPERLPSGVATSQDGGKWRVLLEFDQQADAAATHDWLLSQGVQPRSMVAHPVQAQQSLAPSIHEMNYRAAMTAVENLRAENAALKAQAQQGAGEVVAWMWQHDETGRCGFVEVDQIAMGWQAANPRLQLIRPLTYADTPPTQPAPVVPDALRKWHEAYGRYLHWSGEYNRKHAMAEELKVPFPGPDLNREFQAFTSAQNEAHRLQGPLHEAITAMLTATPTPPAQAAQALSYSDVVEREMTEMADAAIATRQQGGK